MRRDIDGRDMAGIVGGSALYANPLKSIDIIIMYIWNLHMICMGTDLPISGVDILHTERGVNKHTLLVS